MYLSGPGRLHPKCAHLPRVGDFNTLDRAEKISSAVNYKKSIATQSHSCRLARMARGIYTQVSAQKLRKNSMPSMALLRLKWSYRVYENSHTE